MNKEKDYQVYMSFLILFFQLKKEKKECYLSKWRDAKVQGRRKNGAVYIPLLLCQPGAYICSSFYFLNNVFLRQKMFRDQTVFQPVDL